VRSSHGHATQYHSGTLFPTLKIEVLQQIFKKHNDMPNYASKKVCLKEALAPIHFKEIWERQKQSYSM